MHYDLNRIKSLIHYERISQINPDFKLTAEQKEYLAAYRAQKASEDKLRVEEISSEPFQLVRETEDGIEEVDEAAVLETPKKRSRKKKTTKTEETE